MVVNPDSQLDVSVAVRRATEADADAIIAILEGIASERIYTAIDKPWSADQQREHLTSLSGREAIHVAETEWHVLVGYQTLELWATTLNSMAHVGQIGTFLRPDWRGRRIGEALFQRAVDFARTHDYSKFVIQVRSSNTAAQNFYQRLGFRQCGRLTRQVRIDTQEDDEIMMEFFL